MVIVKGAARELLLDTAEQLFADQGVNAVSLRAINAAAGVSPGVLHYHFGNREVLLEALIERRMQSLMEDRQQRVLPLLQQTPPNIDDIISALVQPLADLVLEEGDAGKRYVQFMARLYTERSDVFDKVSKRYIESTTGHFPLLIQQACPQLTMSDISWRLAAANHAMLQTLSDLSKPARHWQQTGSKSEENHPHQIVFNLKAFIAGGFKA